MAAQKEKDKQIELVLAKILQELKKLHGSNQPGARNLPDLIDGTTSVSAATGWSSINRLYVFFNVGPPTQFVFNVGPPTRCVF